MKMLCRIALSENADAGGMPVLFLRDCLKTGLQK